MRYDEDQEPQLPVLLEDCEELVARQAIAFPGAAATDWQAISKPSERAQAMLLAGYSEWAISLECGPIHAPPLH